MASLPRLGSRLGDTWLDLSGPCAAPAADSCACLSASLVSALANPQAWQTPPPMGLPELRQALAARLGLDPAGLAITSGVRGSVRTLTRESGRLIIERPGFSGIERAGLASGAHVRAAPWHEILSGFPGEAPATIWLTHPARNPDGRSLTSDEQARLSDLTCGHHLLVVNQTYRWCEQATPPPLGAVLVGSLHKLIGGGVRLGWLYQEPGLPPLVTGRRPGEPPGPWQAAWAGFIRAGGLETLADRTLRAAQARCQRFVAALGEDRGSAWPYHAGPATVLAWPSPTTQEQLLSAFTAAGVSAGPGAAFGCPPASVRLSFTGIRDADVADAVRRTRTVIKTIGRPA